MATVTNPSASRLDVPSLGLIVEPGGHVTVPDTEAVLAVLRGHGVLVLEEPFGHIPDPGNPNSTVAPARGAAPDLEEKKR